MSEAAKGASRAIVAHILWASLGVNVDRQFVVVSSDGKVFGLRPAQVEGQDFCLAAMHTMATTADNTEVHMDRSLEVVSDP